MKCKHAYIDDSRHQLQLHLFRISCSPLPRRQTSLSWWCPLLKQSPFLQPCGLVALRNDSCHYLDLGYDFWETRSLMPVTMLYSPRPWNSLFCAVSRIDVDGTWIVENGTLTTMLDIGREVNFRAPVADSTIPTFHVCSITKSEFWLCYFWETRIQNSNVV